MQFRIVILLILVLAGLTLAEDVTPLPADLGSTQWQERSLTAWTQDLRGADAKKRAAAACMLAEFLGQSSLGEDEKALGVMLSKTTLPREVGEALGTLIAKPSRDTPYYVDALLALSFGHPGVWKAAWPSVVKALEGTPRLADLPAKDDYSVAINRGIPAVAGALPSAGELAKQAKPALLRLLPAPQDPRLKDEDSNASQVATSILEALGELGPLVDAELNAIAGYLLPKRPHLAVVAIRTIRALEQANLQVAEGLGAVARESKPVNYVDARADAKDALRELAELELPPAAAKAIAAELETLE